MKLVSFEINTALGKARRIGVLSTAMKLAGLQI